MTLFNALLNINNKGQDRRKEEYLLLDHHAFLMTNHDKLTKIHNQIHNLIH